MRYLALRIELCTVVSLLLLRSRTDSRCHGDAAGGGAEAEAEADAEADGAEGSAKEPLEAPPTDMAVVVSAPIMEEAAEG